MQKFPSENGVSLVEKQIKLASAKPTPQLQSIQDFLNPMGVKLIGLNISGSLPANLVLDKLIIEELGIKFEVVVQTIAETQVSLDINTSLLNLTFFHPGIQILIGNVSKTRLSGIRFYFGRFNPEFSLSDAGGTFDMTKKIVTEVTEKHKEAILSTAFVKPGYDWTRDVRLKNHLLQFYNVVSSPETKNAKEHGAFTSNFRANSVEINMLTLIPFPKIDNNTGIIIESGTSVGFKINFNANLGSLIDRIDSGDVSSELNFRNIEFSSIIKVIVDGELIGIINSLEITDQADIIIPNSGFSIVNPELNKIENTINAGPVLLIAGLNLMIEALRIGSAFSSSGNDLPGIEKLAIENGVNESIARLGKGVNEVKPDLIKKISISDIQLKLTEGIKELINANLKAIPGLDLSKVFDLTKKIK